MRDTSIINEEGVNNDLFVRASLNSVFNGLRIDSPVIEKLFEHLFSGHLTEVELAGMLMAMKLRGETPEEICGAARSMRKYGKSLNLGRDVVFDTCGTGGDNSGSFNISTSAAIILSALGVPVAKHGNRSSTGKSGSTDFLEALGIPVYLADAEALAYFQSHNFIYMSAPQYHPAMKFAASVRKGLGVRTIFNYLGPLTNPAGASRQAIGFFSPDYLEKYAEAALALNYERVILYSSLDGMDEVSPFDKTRVFEIQNNTIKSFMINPAPYISLSEAAEIPTHLPPEENAELFTETISCGVITPLAKLLALNSALALFAYNEKTGIRENYTLILEKLLNGSIMSKLSSLTEYYK